MPRVAVYTAFTEGYDHLHAPPPDWAAEADFIAFQEGAASAPGWTRRELSRADADPCRNAKVHKILPHDYLADYDYSLWMDASIQIKSLRPLAELITEHLSGADLCVFRHRKRNCVYQEAEACLAWKNDAPDKILSQVARYRTEGYPEKHGLAECSVLLRRHTPAMAAFDRSWHAEIAAHSRRDQLSFNYVAWRVGFRFNHFPGNFDRNPYFIRRRHLRPPHRPPGSLSA